MTNLSAIDHIYAFEDGDTLIPGMGIIWVNGENNLGLQQYWNPSTNEVIATDFSKHPALLYPRPYSSRMGNIVVPETTGQQWYIGNITEEGGILQDGKVKDRWKDIFEVTIVEANGMTMPALKIKGNIATKEDHTDKYIYYKSSYRNKTIICSQLIPIQESAGESYKVNISSTGADGSGDDVLSNDNDWVELTASLQRSGLAVTDGVTYKWQNLQTGTWKDVTSIEKMQEINGQVLKLYNAGVEGTELFRCLVTYNSKTYIGVKEVSDIHDPYYLDMGRNLPSQSVAKGQTVTYSPKVYERATGNLSTGWSFIYGFTDNDGNELTDVSATTLTYENIKKHQCIAVSIEARKG